MVKIVEKYLNNYFSIATIKGINKNKLTQATKKHTYNYITRTANNNGVSATTGLIEGAKLNPANTFCLNLLQMKVFLQEKPWYAGQFVRLIKPKYNFDKETLLYFQVLINCIAKTFDPQAIKKVDKLFNTAKIKVPVTPTGELDTAYMASYVQKIEASYVQKIEAYLAVLGYKSLADCQLNQHDLDVLQAKPKMRGFTINQLFRNEPISYKYDGRILLKKGMTPIYSSVENNYGILGYSNDKPLFDIHKNQYLVFGDHTRTLNIPNKSFSVADNVKVLKALHKMSIKQILYINTVFHKVIPDLGYSRHWSIAKKLSFQLPITSSGDPDYSFMEDYITAIEKLKVIKIKQYLDQKLLAYQKLTK